MMKKIFLFSLLVFLSTIIQAQSFEGKIVFNVTINGIDDPQASAMLPKEATAYFKGTKSRMEMSLMMGMKNVTITDGATNKSTTLMDLMGNKYAIDNSTDKTTEESKKLYESAKVSITNEKKKIAGYTCTKAIVEFPSLTSKGQTEKIEMWFTKELSLNKSYANGPMSKIDGSVLEFNINQGAFVMNLSAKEVLKQNVSDELFIVPSNYKIMTADELKKSLGGQ